MFILFFILLGLLVGSFLNSVIYRLDELKSIVSHRSHCPHCKKEIAWYDLIPLLSFAALGGKCRHCRKNISWQYPLVEASTASLFALIYYYFGFSYYTLLLLLITCFLMVIFVYDAKKMLIPDIVLIPAIVITIIFWLVLLIPNNNLHYSANFSQMFYGALIGAGFIGLLVLITKGKGMGEGDIKLAMLLGFILGYPNVIIGLGLAFIIGAIAGVIMLVNKSKNLKSAIAFGPYLIIGFYIALFWGEKILSWYIQ